MINIITFFNLLSLGSAFLIPTAAVFFEKDAMLIYLNIYFICTALASLPDAFIQIRLEVFLARCNAELGLGVIRRLFSNYLIVFFAAILSGLIEVFLIGFPFFLVTLTRHIYNISRNCLPQCDIFKSNSWVLNLYAIVRNFLILSVVLLANQEHFSSYIYLITVLEAMVMFIGINMKSKLVLNINFFTVIFLKKILCRVKKTYVKIGFVSGGLASIDRIVISIFFTPEAQVVFLKYKLMYQYIDGFFGVFGYQVHLSIIKTREMISLRFIFFFLFSMFLVGMIGSFILLDINSYLSYFLVMFMVAMMSLKRVIDGLLSSYLISLKEFRVLMVKNIVEILLVSAALMTAYQFFLYDLDKVYFIYVVVTLFVSLVFLITLKRVRENG